MKQVPLRNSIHNRIRLHTDPGSNALQEKIGLLEIKTKVKLCAIPVLQQQD